ncbi:MAG: hypothetical protein HYV09_09105 [Deltaproteobacteria bacterium]|nr:hypothetical protein [Deltaproteobacteria bacterium]
MVRLLVASLIVMAGCAGKLETSAADAGTGGVGPSCDETGGAPPIDCPPVTGPTAPACSSVEKVKACPTDNPCMAPVKQSGAVLSHRIGRLRFWAPASMSNLAAIAFDPNVNAHCANSGTEGLSWLLQLDRGADTLRVGSSPPSPDGRTFSFLPDLWSGEALAAVCPGFIGPASPASLASVETRILKSGSGFAADVIPQLNVAIFDASGVPMVLPLREVTIRADAMPDPTCIGSWNPNLWCDGDSLGWTTGGTITAKITAEDADRVPVRPAGCQSLCAIFVNDATKTEGKVCKRGSDGKLPEIGDACVGGTGCKNAFLMRMSFASYGVTIKP